MVVGEERQARNLQDPQRRKPAGAWRHADPRRRRLGAFLLHRLSQSPPGLSEGVCRSSGELGICRRAVLEGLTLALSFRDGPKDQTADVQLHIGESRDSGFDAEPVIGPRFARTRWHRPGMTRWFRANVAATLPSPKSSITTLSPAVSQIVLTRLPVSTISPAERPLLSEAR